MHSEKFRPLVSVIMNCYNGEKYLNKAIDSVYKQSYKNWEIIFWDNASTDSSSRIASLYTEKLKYYCSNKNTKLYDARNFAIEKASGDLVAFLDVDDWWSEDKLRLQVEVFLNKDIGMAYSNFWIENGKKKIAYKHTLPTGDIIGDLLKKYPVAMSTMIVRNDIFKTHKLLFDSNYNIIGDFDFAVSVATRWKVGCVQKPLMHYRVHDNNLSNTNREEKNNELREWIANIKNDKVINNSNFIFRKYQLLFSESLLLANNGKIYSAIKHATDMPLVLQFKLVARVVINKLYIAK